MMTQTADTSRRDSGIFEYINNSKIEGKNARREKFKRKEEKRKDKFK